MAHAHPLKLAAQHPAVARIAPFAVFVALLGLASLLGRTGAVDPDDLRWLNLARWRPSRNLTWRGTTSAMPGWPPWPRPRA